MTLIYHDLSVHLRADYVAKNFKSPVQIFLGSAALAGSPGK